MPAQPPAPPQPQARIPQPVAPAAPEPAQVQPQARVPQPVAPLESPAPKAAPEPSRPAGQPQVLSQPQSQVQPATAPKAASAQKPGSAEAGPGTFEAPGNLRLADVAPLPLQKGPHHRVEERVDNDGFMNIYTVRSRYGTFRVTSTALLAIRVDECSAMAAMDEMNSGKEYGKGLAEGVKSVFTGAANLVTDPVNTVSSAASGVGRLFERTSESMNGSPPSRHEDSAMAKLTGYAETRRETAKAFGVDPYSTNPALLERLDRVAEAGHAGSLTAMGLKVLIPGGVGLAVATVGGVNWLNDVDVAKPPSELRLENRRLLQSLRLPEAAVTAFMDNSEYTPTQQTLLVKAVSRLPGVEGLAVMLRVAARATDQDQTFFRVRQARMMAAYHKRVEPLAKVFAVGQVLLAVTAGKTWVVCLPVDYLTWNAKSADAVAGIRAELGPDKGVQIWLGGQASPLARKELLARGFTVRERAGRTLTDERF